MPLRAFTRCEWELLVVRGRSYGTDQATSDAPLAANLVPDGLGVGRIPAERRLHRSLGRFHDFFADARNDLKRTVVRLRDGRVPALAGSTARLRGAC